MVAMDNKQNDLLLPRRGPEEVAIDNCWSVSIHKGTYNDSPNTHLYCRHVDKGLPRTATIRNMDSLGVFGGSIDARLPQSEWTTHA